MNRLEQRLNHLKQNNKKATSVFIPGGYPNYESTLNLLKDISDNDIDFIELGMPFTDPSADGPTIQQAGVKALENGATVRKNIEVVSEFRKHNNETPIVWMGYYNNVFNYGEEKFFADIKAAGFDAIIIPDLPLEEQEETLKHAEKNDVCVINFITPMTDEARLAKITENARGFLYYISVMGITGDKEANQLEIQNNIKKIKETTELPIIVGFGVNTPQKANDINKLADGVIIGTKFIQDFNEHMTDKESYETQNSNWFFDYFIKEIE